VPFPLPHVLVFVVASFQPDQSAPPPLLLLFSTVEETASITVERVFCWLFLVAGGLPKKLAGAVRSSKPLKELFGIVDVCTKQVLQPLWYLVIEFETNACFVA